MSLRETLQGDRFASEGETDETNIREVRGAQWHPHPYEVILIAVSILERRGNWAHVERLLKDLDASSNLQNSLRSAFTLRRATVPS